MQIGILADGFIGWGGGIDFIRLLLRAILVADSENKPQIFLICAREQVFGSKALRMSLKIARSFYNATLFKRKNNLQVISVETLHGAFGDLVEKKDIFLYSGCSIDLAKLCVEKKIDILLPSIRPLPSNFQTPWVGYIFDFQHKYLPQFFTFRARHSRDRLFRTMLKQAKQVLVNSKAVENDCRKFIKHIAAVLHPLPFTPVSFGSHDDFLSTSQILKKYNLPKAYFLISNQLWVHKNHETAIRAFALAFSGNKSVGLVCTGATQDDRAPGLLCKLQNVAHSLQISDQVHILGRIPKAEQLHLMKGSIAVVQPTLFEGGPGGGQVYESIALGIRSIVSDLPVNREICEGNIEFFSPTNSIELAEILKNHFEQKPPRLPTTAEMKEMEKERLLRLNRTIHKICDAAISSWQSEKSSKVL